MLIYVDRGWNLNTAEHGKHFYYKKGRQIPVLCDHVKLQLANWAQARGRRWSAVKQELHAASVCLG